MMLFPPRHGENLVLVDNLLIEIWGQRKSGRRRLLDRYSTHNLVTNAGKNFAASRLLSSGAAVVNWLALGTGVTTPTVGDTALVTEVFRDTLTSATQTSIGVATFVYSLGTTSANGNTLAEVALLNAASVGTMLARALISPSIAKSNSKSVTFTWVVTFA